MKVLLFILFSYGLNGQPIGIFEAVSDSDYQIYYDNYDKLIDTFDRSSEHGDIMAEIIGRDMDIHSVSFSFFADKNDFSNPQDFAHMLSDGIDSLVISGCRHILMAWGINRKSMMRYDFYNWTSWLSNIESTVRAKAREYNAVTFVIAAGNDGRDVIASKSSPANINDLDNVHVVGSSDDYSSTGDHLYEADGNYKEHEGTSISAAKYLRKLYEADKSRK